MHSSIAAVTFYTPSYQIAHIQEKECNMNTTNTRRGFTQTKNAVNKNQCHSRGMLSGIYNACYCKNHVMLNSFQHLHLTQTCDKKEEILNQVQDDNSIKEEALNKGSFRATLRSGFTLIELLVVVLIIGILAAVALPQYQKAVEKSRATQALALLKPMAQAVESYYLANGEYPTSFADLDVDMPAWTGTTGWLVNSQASDTISNEDWSLQIVRSHGGLYIGRISGPYAGAGWGYFPQTPGSVVLPLKKILCAERTANGILFTKQTGDYCQKVMGLSNHYNKGSIQWFD